MSYKSKYNIVYRMQKWMDTVAGQTFLNYAYSWGASVVILGALFKLTHLPGANIMLFVGMGTEVVVFFISAFDRPFDKTADGREIPTRVTQEYLETGVVTYEKTGEQFAPGGIEVGGNKAPVARSAVRPEMTVAEDESRVAAAAEAQTVEPMTQTDEPVARPAETVAQSVAQPAYVPQMSAEEAEALNEAQAGYVEELKKLVDTLAKVNEQSTRLTRDSEEMENLNRTLTGISKVYEMQLKGASQQIGTIDQINEQSRKMAQQIEQLNKIYARMIEAMTVNMQVAAPGAQGGQQSQTNG